MACTIAALLVLGHCQAAGARVLEREPELNAVSLLQTELSVHKRSGSHLHPGTLQSGVTPKNLSMYWVASLYSSESSMQGAWSSAELGRVTGGAAGNGPDLMPVICGSLLAVLCAGLLWTFREVPSGLLAQRRQGAPGEAAAEGGQPLMAKAAVVLFYGVIYMACSVALIKYNKFLIAKDRFPFAMNLALGHQICGSAFLLLLYILNSSLFPSLVDPDKRAKCFSLHFLSRAAVPIAGCFSLQLVLSNAAYLYASVAFLQMMKEGNMVLVYILSLVSGLELFHFTNMHVLCCLLLSTMLTVEGELSFSLRGFAMQGSSQFAEATKIVVQSSLLSAAGSAKLDALSYNFLIQPISGLVLFLSVLVGMNFIPSMATATWADYAAWWPHLLGNGCVALSLNLVVALFISKTSAVGFIVCGIVKDIVLVSADVLLSGTVLSRQQVVAFVLQLGFAGTFSLLKLYERKPDGDSVKSKTGS